MVQARCRWGILGAAAIARKNWRAIHNAENCTLTAVASRDPGRAQHFVADCQRQAPFDPPPRVCSSYEELLADDAVDAVYIPLPTGLRKPWILRAAAAGKHVLSEKPVAPTLAEAEEIIAACRRANVQFMDGVMFQHSRRMPALHDVLADGQSVGPIRRLVSHFSFGGTSEFFANDIRMHSGLEPLGCLGDLGWYCVRFTLDVFGGKLPQRVCAHTLAEGRRPDSPGPVPTEFSAELFYADGVSAAFYCSFLADIQQWAVIGGTRGFVHVPDFVLPHYGAEVAFDVSNPAFHVTGCDFNMEEHRRRVAVREYANSAPWSQEAAMFRTFAQRVLANRPDERWSTIALQTQRVVEACLRSAAAGGTLLPLA